MIFFVPSLLQITAGLLLGATVAAVLINFKDYLIELCRKIILPALGRLMWLAADAIRTLIDVVEKVVTYTAREIRAAVKKFQKQVLAMTSEYETVSETEVDVQTRVYTYVDGDVHEKATGQRVSMNQLPEAVREKLKQRHYVQVDQGEELVNLANRQL